MQSRWIFWVVVLACSTVGFAQTAGAQAIPRTPDGKPDLAGTWTPDASGRTEGGIFAGESRGGQSTMELTKWGLEKFQWNRGPQSASAPGVYRGQHVRSEYDPVYHCYPLGLVRLGPPTDAVGRDRGNAIEILQTPGKVILIYMYRNSVRHIYTDGREHPKIVELTWNGHSIGKWDGDTLVVDTIGLRDESWLDGGGHEHSTQLHIVERFRRVDHDTLQIERTLTDPVALAEPFTTRVSLRFRENRALNENYDGRVFDCSQFMVRKPAFGEGENTLLGISEPTTGKY